MPTGDSFFVSLFFRYLYPVHEDLRDPARCFPTLLFRYMHPVHALEEEAATVPMKWLVVGIGANPIAAEHQPVYRFGVEDGSIKCIELVVFDDDTRILSPWKKPC